MIGAIIGDVIGSVYEWKNIKTVDFPLYNDRARYTDDTVLTIATAEAILKGTGFGEAYKKWGRLYANAGFGGSFKRWLHQDSFEPYNSWGNGSAMRVSPVGFAYDTLDDVMRVAKKSAEVTHNHPEGIKGAQATAVSIFLARTGATKSEIRQFVEAEFNYDLSRKIEEIRPEYKFDVSCQGSVPESIIAFLESSNFENSIRLAISLGGDSDTIACITGSISQAFYTHIDQDLIEFVKAKLSPHIVGVVDKFEEKYKI